MMFWIVAGAACVVLFAIAWWTSGRTPRPSRLDAAARRRDADTVAQTERDGMHVTGPNPGF